MKKNIKMTMTALAAALCLTAAPAYAEGTDLSAFTSELQSLKGQADSLQTMLDNLQKQIDTCEQAIETATGVDIPEAPAAGTTGSTTADGAATAAESKQGQNILLNETFTVRTMVRFRYIRANSQMHSVHRVRQLTHW